MMQAVAGFAGRLSRRRTENVHCRESERVREKKEGMVSTEKKLIGGRMSGGRPGYKSLTAM
jgi:hypothetical protein